MKITKISPLTGKQVTMDLPITEQQVMNWKHGLHAQDAFPNLTPGQREFIISGTTEEEWDQMFGEKDEYHC